MNSDEKNVKMVRLGDFLSQGDINKARKLYPNVSAIAQEVIEPQIEEINRKLGQENDAMYLAYAVIYAFDTGARRKT